MCFYPSDVQHCPKLTELSINGVSAMFRIKNCKFNAQNVVLYMEEPKGTVVLFWFA